MLIVLALTGCSTHAPSHPEASPGVVDPAALVLDAPEAPVVLSIEPWTFQGAPGRVISTPHYRIFTTVGDSMLFQRVPLFMETAFGQYTTALAPLPMPDAPLDMFLMAKRWQWSRLTQQLMGAQAETYLRIPRGGYSAGGRAILYDIGIRDTLAIAAHEGWHQYTQRMFRDGLPIWLEEGIATYMEGYRSTPGRRELPQFMGWANIERFDQLRAAEARGALMPLDRLLDSSPQSLLADTTAGTLTYYAQVWALVHFLNEGEGGRYRAGLQAVVRDAAAGQMRRAISDKVGPGLARRAAVTRQGPAVILTYFTLDIEQISAQYAAFMNELVRTGSKDLIVQGKSPMAR